MAEDRQAEFQYARFVARQAVSDECRDTFVLHHPDREIPDYSGSRKGIVGDDQHVARFRLAYGAEHADDIRRRGMRRHCRSDENGLGLVERLDAIIKRPSAVHSVREMRGLCTVKFLNEVFCRAFETTVDGQRRWIVDHCRLPRLVDGFL